MCSGGGAEDKTKKTLGLQTRTTGNPIFIEYVKASLSMPEKEKNDRPSSPSGYSEVRSTLTRVLFNKCLIGIFETFKLCDWNNIVKTENIYQVLCSHSPKGVLFLAAFYE